MNQEHAVWCRSVAGPVAGDFAGGATPGAGRARRIASGRCDDVVHAVRGREPHDAHHAMQRAVVVADRARLVGRVEPLPARRDHRVREDVIRALAPHALLEARADTLARVGRDQREPVGERRELRRRHTEQRARVPGHLEAAARRVPFVREQPVRADRRLETRLPFARRAQRIALRGREHGDQQRGQRHRHRVALNLERVPAQIALGAGKRPAARRRVRERHHRAGERDQRGAAHAPQQRDDREKEERQVRELIGEAVAGEHDEHAGEEASRGDRTAGERGHRQPADAHAELLPGDDHRRHQQASRRRRQRPDPKGESTGRFVRDDVPDGDDDAAGDSGHQRPAQCERGEFARTFEP